MENKNYYAVLMAGGIGSRFWPVSTTSFPKQFHDMLGTGSSLIQKTFARLSKTVPEENIFILTNSKYEDLVKEQLPNVTDSPRACNEKYGTLYIISSFKNSERKS